jgi:hypothetical protein
VARASSWPRIGVRFRFWFRNSTRANLLVGLWLGLRLGLVLKVGLRIMVGLS